MAFVRSSSGWRATSWRVCSHRSWRSLAFRPRGAAGYWNCYWVLDRCSDPPVDIWLAPAHRRAGSPYSVYAPARRYRTDILDSTLRYCRYLRGDDLSRVPTTAVHGPD